MENITVAVVDDHSLLRKSICAFLSEMGFEVIMEAANGNEMLYLLRGSSRLPQVCLIDYNMPGMKGYELAAILNEEYPEIKLAAYTSNTTISSLIKMLQNGCCAYFIKNGNPSELEAGIKDMVQNGYHFSEWMKQALLSYIQMNHAIR